jgi:hypothetical protein
MGDGRVITKRNPDSYTIALLPVHIAKQEWMSQEEEMG